MFAFELFLIALLGLIIGSFLTALTYRIPKGISIARGRSFCPKCKSMIAWYDNIPLLSYLLLGGKCRKCRKKISIRYPLIEFFTSLSFVFIYLVDKFDYISFLQSPFYFWSSALGQFTLPFFYIVLIILLAIFIIDLEKQIIPDNLVFVLYLIVWAGLVFTHLEGFYSYILGGFTAAAFLLFLVFLTKGKGMGLGDVKLAIPLGTILGLTNSVIWLFLSFLTGAYIGIILILVKKARVKDNIAFGPFLIFSFFIALFWGRKILVNIGLF